MTPNPQPCPPVPHTRGIPAELTAAEDKLDPATPANQPPIVSHNPDAIDMYSRLGGHDAANPGADVHTGPQRPATPSAGFVIAAARTPLAVLGERFAKLQTEFALGVLGRVEPAMIRTRDVVSAAAPYLVGMVLLGLVAIVVEIVYGRTAAMLLTEASAGTALAAAIALSLTINGAALVAGGFLYKTMPVIVRRQGVKVAIVAAILIVILAITLGLVIGGYHNIGLNTVSGGAATTVQTTLASHKPLLAVTYTTIMGVVAFAMAAGHLLIADILDTRRAELVIAARRKAAADSPDREAQCDLALELCRRYLSAIPEAHGQGRLRIAAYISQFKQDSTPEMAELFTYPVYDDSEPVWANDVRSMIDDLEAHSRRRATITRIA